MHVSLCEYGRGGHGRGGHGRGGHGRGGYGFGVSFQIKHHTILQRIPCLNRPDSRPLGLVNIYDRIDTFAGQLLKHWVKAVRELCAVVRAQVAALGRSQRVSEVGLQGLGQLKKEDKVTF